MYEYNIKLKFKIENCATCPFKHERITNENIESTDKLSGVLVITRRQCFCPLKDEPIFFNETVEGYNSKCPLKGKVKHIDDKEN